MEMFRLSHADYADLSGLGGLYSSGRWHEKGVLACYTATSRSLAVLERLVHESFEDMPQLIMMTIWVPDDVVIERYTAKQLPRDWDTLPDSGTARAISKPFFQNKKALLLQVPSAIVSDEYNYIINPAHPDFRNIKIVETTPYFYDLRLQKMIR